VVIGVASVIILVSVGSGLRGLVAGQFASLGANLLMVVPGRVSGSNFSSFASFTNQGKFTQNELRTISSLDGVVAVAADLDEFMPAKYKNKTMTTLVGGANEDFVEVFNWGVAEGRFFSRGEMDVSKKVVVIGDKVKNELFKAEDPLGKSLVVGNERYKIVGVLRPKGGFGQFDWDVVVYMPIGAAQKLFGRERLDMLYFKISDKASFPISKS